jgi:hypothetical protein
MLHIVFERNERRSSCLFNHITGPPPPPPAAEGAECMGAVSEEAQGGFSSIYRTIYRISRFVVADQSVGHEPQAFEQYWRNIRQLLLS